MWLIVAIIETADLRYSRSVGLQCIYMVAGSFAVGE